MSNYTDTGIELTIAQPFLLLDHTAAQQAFMEGFILIPLSTSGGIKTIEINSMSFSPFGEEDRRV